MPVEPVSKSKFLKYQFPKLPILNTHISKNMKLIIFRFILFLKVKSLQSIIFINSMKVSIFSLFLVLLLLTVNCKDQAPQNQDDQNDDQDITTMTFLVEYEPEEDNDIVEIGVLVEAQKYSLKDALKSANQLVAKVTHVVQQFCQNYPPEGEDASCDEAVDTGDFDITADYEKVRRQLEFSKFIVSYQITIKVFATEKIGELADDLIKIGVTKIQSFDWVSNDEDESEEGAIEAGQQKSHDMCFHLGMKLHRIVSVEGVEEEAAEEGGEEEQGEEEQQEESPVVYKFQIQCVLDEDTAREKAESQEEQKAEKQKQEKEKKQREEDDDEEDEKPKKKAKKDKKKSKKQ